MNDFSNLPKSWQIKTLGEVCEIISKGATPKNQLNSLNENGAIFLKVENITQNGCIAFNNVKFIDFETHTKILKRSILKNLDILISIAGSLARCAVLEIDNNQQINTNQAISFARLKDTKQVNPYFIKFYIMSPAMQIYLLSKAKTTAVPNLTLEIIRDIQIPLPPLEIQKRIVARLESAFEKIEKGSAHLQDAKTKLAKYKQSLLKSAFNGTLTATASLQGVEKAETIHTAASLRASVESVAIHTKALDCHSPNGLRNDEKDSPSLAEGARGWVNPINDNTLDCHDLTSSKLAMTDKENPKLPQGWTIKTLGEIGEIVTGSTPNTKNREYYGDEYPFYKPTDLNLGYCVENSSNMVSSKGFEISRKLPSKSILVTCIGTIGKTGLIRSAGICNQQINAIIPKQNICPEFVYFYCISNAMQELLKTNASATTIPILNKTAFSKLPIPLPPLETQKQIVKLLERHFECADKTDKFIESALNKAKQLKQSLLKSAFLGELV